jgi:hypothetical protein
MINSDDKTRDERINPNRQSNPTHPPIEQQPIDKDTR